MVEYETDSSPFFKANKDYCEMVEQALKPLHASCSGFCNSYGYDIKTSFTKNGVSWILKFHKHQSTQQGSVVPVDAIDYCGTTVEVTGLNPALRTTIEKSVIKRFLLPSKFKKEIPSPYFVKFSPEPTAEIVSNLAGKMLGHNIYKFRLSEGKLICKIHGQVANPLELMADINAVFLDLVNP